jgi:hypothetical protein
VATTTVRVDVRTHAKLVELSEASGSSLIETVRDAAEALRRQRFAHQVAEELSALREDRVAWAEYVAEAESTDVADGIDR